MIRDSQDLVASASQSIEQQSGAPVIVIRDGITKEIIERYDAEENASALTIARRYKCDGLRSIEAVPRVMITRVPPPGDYVLWREPTDLDGIATAQEHHQRKHNPPHALPPLPPPSSRSAREIDHARSTGKSRSRSQKHANRIVPPPASEVLAPDSQELEAPAHQDLAALDLTDANAGRSGSGDQQAYRSDASQPLGATAVPPASDTVPPTLPDTVMRGEALDSGTGSANQIGADSAVPAPPLRVRLASARVDEVALVTAQASEALVQQQQQRTAKSASVARSTATRKQIEPSDSERAAPPPPPPPPLAPSPSVAPSAARNDDNTTTTNRSKKKKPSRARTVHYEDASDEDHEAAAVAHEKSPAAKRRRSTAADSTSGAATSNKKWPDSLVHAVEELVSLHGWQPEIIHKRIYPILLEKYADALDHRSCDAILTGIKRRFPGVHDALMGAKEAAKQDNCTNLIGVCAQCNVPAPSEPCAWHTARKQPCDTMCIGRAHLPAGTDPRHYVLPLQCKNLHAAIVLVHFGLLTHDDLIRIDAPVRETSSDTSMNIEKKRIQRRRAAIMLLHAAPSSMIAAASASDSIQIDPQVQRYARQLAYVMPLQASNVAAAVAPAASDVAAPSTTHQTASLMAVTH